MSGCTDNSAMLRRIQTLALNIEKRVFTQWYDFSKAFDSPDHLLIWKILEWFNIPRYIVSIIQSMYSGVTIRVRLGKGKLTQSIPIEIGVLQGCTGSPVIFILLEELLLRLLNALENNGVEVSPGVSVCAAAFADDLNTNSTRWEAAQEQNCSIVSRT
jgi:hypothetical protein